MTRYLIPSIAIPALYSTYRNYFYPPADNKPVKTIDEAIEILNTNGDVNGALKFIQTYSDDASYLSRLTPVSWARLALRGSTLCQRALILPTDPGMYSNFEDILTKFNLGDDWNSAVEWINRVACPEEDLACSEEWLVRRPSQVERLLRILQMLFIKTEQPFDENCVSKDIVPFLYHLFTEFRGNNSEIASLALKCLSNVALNGFNYAANIFTSEWMPLLSELVDKGFTLEERLLAHKICQNSLHSLGVVDYKLNSDIYELFLPDREAIVDIVLIHGLCGSVAYTWRQNDAAHNIVTECWPKDWLPLDIREPMRILGIDYPSYLLHFTGTMESLQARADRFKKQLLEARIGKKHVVFICHSMGGLLAKRLLLDLPELAEKTVGILFIATPHRGSPIASWGYSILHPSEDVRFLHEENIVNKQLNEDFSKICDKIPVIVSMVETKKSSLVGSAKGIIVPTQSAVFERGAVYHIDEVHHNVCKPTTRSSPSYGVVINFLRDCIQEILHRKYS